MKLQHQLTSLALSKRLKGFGATQKSIFYWIYDKGTGTENIVAKKRFGYEVLHNGLIFENKSIDALEKYSAFTVAELGEMLPARYGKGKYAEALDIFKRNNQKWNVCYSKIMPNRDVNMPLDIATLFSDEILADAMAKMLIHLIELGLLSAGELASRD